MNGNKVTTTDQTSCNTGNTGIRVLISNISLDGTGKYIRLTDLIGDELKRQKPELTFTLYEIQALHDGYRHYGHGFMTDILPIYLQIRDTYGFPVEYFSMVANFPVSDTIGRRVIGKDYSNWAFYPPTETISDIPKDDLVRIITRHLRFHKWILDHNAGSGFPMQVSEDGIAERLREASDDIREKAHYDSPLPVSFLNSFED